MYRNLAIYYLIDKPLTVSNASSRSEAETFDVELHDKQMSTGHEWLHDLRLFLVEL